MLQACVLICTILLYLLPEAVRQTRSPQTTAFPSLSSAPRLSPAGLSGAEPRTGHRFHLFHSGAAFPASKDGEAHS